MQKKSGSRGEDIKVGDRVFSSGIRPANDWPGSCWGGHVESHIAREQNVIKLPVSVSTHEGSEPLLAQRPSSLLYEEATRDPTRQESITEIVRLGKKCL